ncbi:hypothetical protein C8R47DRAFT_1227760 [Mycena vitilis]|nr:hypothetical protein C8R47DRAFT_1227760 [Mycena vitilis]
MPVTPKNRPPPALLSASAHYLALRVQLAAELPAYLSLLHRGLAALIPRLHAHLTDLGVELPAFCWTFHRLLACRAAAGRRRSAHTAFREFGVRIRSACRRASFRLPVPDLLFR